MEPLKDPPSYRIVFLAQAAAVFPHGTGYKADFQGDQTPVEVRVTTRFDEMLVGHPVPREICLEANLSAGSIDEAIDTGRQAASFLVPFLAFAANAEVGQPAAHLAYETTSDSSSREFVQFHYPEHKDPPGRGRIISADHLKALLDVYNAEPQPRMWRCLAQYNFALGYWFQGSEFLALSHLWMAVETLLPLIVADVCAEESMTLEELAQSKGIDLQDPRWKGYIAATVRRERVFQGDGATHRRAKLASDGLEHGFAEADDIQTNAIDVCDKVFQYLRAAIIGHLRIPAPLSAVMESKEPIDTHSSKKMIRAELRGDVTVEQLSLNGQRYPRFGWTTTIKEVIDQGDSFSITLNENFVKYFGAGISVENFHLVAMWRPTTAEVESVMESRSARGSE